MNKKSTIAIEKSIFYGFVIAILLSILFIVLVFIIGIDVMGYTKIAPGLEEFIFTQRFLNSPQCFIYQDKDTGMFKPRIIDWDKFNTYSPSKCYFTTNENNPAFRFSLYNLDTNEKIIDPSIKTKNWHGDPNKYKEFNIKIFKDNTLYNGKLIMEIKNVE